MKLVSGIILSLFATSAFAGTIRHDTPDWIYQAIGNTPELASVGAIIGSNSGGDYGCGGTVIDKHWMLTAAHCVQPATSLDFYLSDGVGGFNSYRANSWLANPNFNENNLLAGWDIGLVYFNQELAADPAKIYRGNNEPENIGVISGYGASGDGLNGTTGPFGTKRAGFNLLSFAYSSEGNGQQILWGDFDAPQHDNPYGASDLFGDGSAINFEYSPSYGDSGGGLFIWDTNQYYLAGVNSFLFDGNSNNIWADYGDGFGATRVSSFSEWIDVNLGYASVPESNPLVLFAIATAGLILRRRFNRN